MSKQQGVDHHALADHQMIDSFREGWKIENEADAEWALGEINGYDDQIERVKRNAESMIRQLEAAKKHAVEHLGAHLEDFYRRNPPKRGKTIKMLNGKLSTRTIKGGPRLPDENKARTTAWAKEHAPEFVTRVVPEPYDKLDWAGLKKQIEAGLVFMEQEAARKEDSEPLEPPDGAILEVPDGVVLQEDEERFEIKP